MLWNCQKGWRVRPGDYAAKNTVQNLTRNWLRLDTAALCMSTDTERYTRHLALEPTAGTGATALQDLDLATTAVAPVSISHHSPCFAS